MVSVPWSNCYPQAAQLLLARRSKGKQSRSLQDFWGHTGLFEPPHLRGMLRGPRGLSLQLWSSNTGYSAELGEGPVVIPPGFLKASHDHEPGRQHTSCSSSPPVRR